MEGKFEISLRRLRLNAHIRSLVAPTRLSYNAFIQPIFVQEGLEDVQQTMPSVYIDTQDSVLKTIESDLKGGVKKFLLFVSVLEKSRNDKSIADTIKTVQFTCKVIEKIKQRFGEDICLMLDVCLCGILAHGHCGVVSAQGEGQGGRQIVLNDESVKMLQEIALQYAAHGADVIAPSDMMDGRVAGIRQILDKNDLAQIPIMSYSAKFCSNLYGPFRDAHKSCPASHFSTIKDRKSYQIDFANGADAVESALRDAAEGADIIMVKPALYYLDIIKTLAEKINKPIAAYHVSGEYMANELLASSGYTTRSKIHIEAWSAIVRAGATVVISYAARNAKQWILEEQDNY